MPLVPLIEHKNLDFVLGKVSSALTCSSEALVRGMDLLERSGNLGLRAFEFVASAVLGYLA